jgi:hypothetical protein
VPPRCRDRPAELHRDAPLVGALCESGSTDPAVPTAPVQGVVDAATHLIESGTAPNG